MTTRQIFWLNVVLFLGLVAISISTLCFIVHLWPSAAGDRCIDLCGTEINMEKRYFLLVALGGVLGSFIHIATSYVDFLGNKKMVYSWVPWYLMRPFIGASLALIFYMLLRGGIVSTQTLQSKDEKTTLSELKELVDKLKSSSNTADSLKADSLQKAAIQATVNPKDNEPAPKEEPEPALPFNPFGIMAIACLTGLFSKQATDKLEEVFNSMFNIKESEKGKRANPLRGNDDTPTNLPADNQAPPETLL